MERVSYFQKKKARAEETGQGPDKDFWMLTFSDLLQLLLTFFVLLISMSSMDIGFFREMFRVFSGSVGVLGYSEHEETGKPDIRPRIMPPVIDMDALNQLMSAKGPQEVREGIAIPVASRLEELAGQGVDYELKGEKFSMIVPDEALFASGNATLKGTIAPMLDNIAEVLAFSNNQIIIEGHTDDMPVRNDEFRSNWELSAARAGAVMNYLAARGIDPARMEAVGYGPYHPRVKNIGEEYRKRNRRVEITIKQLAEKPF